MVSANSCGPAAFEWLAANCPALASRSRRSSCTSVVLREGSSGPLSLTSLYGPGQRRIPWFPRLDWRPGDNRSYVDIVGGWAALLGAKPDDIEYRMFARQNAVIVAAEAVIPSATCELADTGDKPTTVTAGKRVLTTGGVELGAADHMPTSQRRHRGSCPAT
jgi:hypothetical protein